jgi:hypothetical protein
MPSLENRTHRPACIIAAALIALPLAQAAAQTLPVQNIDEPGRNPYQEYKSAYSLKSGQSFFTQFSSPPANTRRVLKHVNCRVKVSFPNQIYDVTLGNGTDQNDDVPTLSTRIIGTSTVTVFGENPEMYVESLAPFPFVLVSTNDPNPIISCRLSGYDVNLAAPVTPPPS